MKISAILTVFFVGITFAKGNETFQMANILEEYGRISLKSAEIAAYMPDKKRLFVVGDENVMEVVDLSNPQNPKKLESYSLKGSATSVTTYGNFVAVSILGEPEWERGYVEFLEVKDSIIHLGLANVCYHPDMLTFTPDGKNILVACEGEPDEDAKVDPEGGIAILDVEKFLQKQNAVTVLPFKDVSLEPEYITVSKDSKTAWVSLQENNALAKVDILNKKITEIFDLGFVDHSQKGFAIDGKKDGKIQIENAPIRSIRQPDGIKYFERKGIPYVITANEGNELDNYDKSKICGKELNCSVMFGSRSVSIFEGNTGKLIWDSGEVLEQTIAKYSPEYFNWNSKKGKKKVDTRSNRKGCEPENATVGMVGNKLLAFVSLERMSAIAVFDFTNVAQPQIVDYYLNPTDRGPEGILFIDGEHSPIKGQPLLVVGYEYSKTLVVYLVK